MYTLGLNPRFCQSASNGIDAECWSIAALGLLVPNSMLFCLEGELPKLKSRLWSAALPEESIQFVPK